MIVFSQPDRSGNTKDSFRRQLETWRRAYAEACTLRERFPKVEELVLDMVFVDSKEIGTYSPQMRSFSASAKAFFAIACPRTLCLEGGFDLNSIVGGALRGRAGRSVGSLECQGWIDPTHGENARCLLRLHYRVQVRFGSPPRASRRA
jgi:hypothetical protein